MKGNRNISWGIILFLTIVCLSGCTLDRIAAQQTKTTHLWDELVGGETFGQAFVSSRNNLYRIDLSMATFARVNSAPVIIHLKKSPHASSAIFSITLSGSDIHNERPTSIDFTPLPNSGGKSYYIHIESPGAKPGNAITVYANENDQYPDGSAYRNGQIVSGDLAFTAYSRETFTISSILRDWMLNASQDLPFFLCYGILILAVSSILFLSIRKRN